MTDEWEIRTETRTVVYLYRNGSPIVDTHAKPYEWPSEEVARHAAEHWEDYRIPSWEKLQAMTQDDIISRINRCLKLGLR